MSRAAIPHGMALFLLLLALAGCGKPDPAQKFQRPDQVVDFNQLYGQHCAGCHGADGRKGPAPPLNDPLFLALVSDAELERVATEGRRDTLMPAFGQKHGGPLTPEQIAILRQGIRARWKADPVKPDLAPDFAAVDQFAKTPSAERGQVVFAATCANCHGDKGQGTQTAGAVNDPTFLALISNQALYRLVITGRPDLDMPDYRHQFSEADAGARPLTQGEIFDLVELLASWRRSQ